MFCFFQYTFDLSIPDLILKLNLARSVVTNGFVIQELLPVFQQDNTVVKAVFFLFLKRYFSVELGHLYTGARKKTRQM